jgi:hypothetical protein
MNPEPPRTSFEGRRSPVTRQAILMTAKDGEAYRDFIAEFIAALHPENIVEIQLAQRLAQDTWRINRLHAIEENLFVLGHAEPLGNVFANPESRHPELRAATVQAATFRRDPQLFSWLTVCEQRITRNFHVNFRLLLKLQAMRPATPRHEIAKLAAAA